MASKHGKLCAGREFRGTMLGDVSGISVVKNGPETWKTVVTLTGVDERERATRWKRATTLANLAHD